MSRSLSYLFNEIKYLLFLDTKRQRNNRRKKDGTEQRIFQRSSSSSVLLILLLVCFLDFKHKFYIFKHYWFILFTGSKYIHVSPKKWYCIQDFLVFHVSNAAFLGFDFVFFSLMKVLKIYMNQHPIVMNVDSLSYVYISFYRWPLWKDFFLKGTRFSLAFVFFFNFGQEHIYIFGVW